MENATEFQYPNERIYEKYGSLDEDDSVLAKAPVLLIRHGISNYNVYSNELRAKLLMEYPDDKQKRLDLEMKEFSDYEKNSFLVDALLQEPNGHDQSLNQQKLINKFNFVKVLVSPHRRTIQTAVNILKSHPQLEKGITFVLYPMAKEIVNNANDMPVSREELLSFTEDVKRNNPKITFDLSLMPSESPNTWHIQILQNEELK